MRARVTHSALYPNEPIGRRNIVHSFIHPSVRVHVHAVLVIREHLSEEHVRRSPRPAQPCDPCSAEFVPRFSFRSETLRYVVFNR